MPGMDGHEVCRRLKASPVTSDIPVIFVTAKSEIADEKSGFALGAVDYITKPVSMPIVQARVKNHIGIYDQQRELERKVIARTEQLENTRVEMQRHVEYGAEILGRHESELLTMAREICLYHHEKFDGSGYPHKLKGGDIPLSTRIVAIADVYDALTSQRPYKKAWPVDKALVY